MDYWLEVEIRAHRDRLHLQAECYRRARLARMGRQRGLRVRIADAMLRLSGGLARAASALREGERA
ncbi:MAG TPA: hypothetical protein VMW12_09670 [Candidatus Dormibacteraeota bacterium]|nr:hypothetical protein [Candidatus Dormibacteraeota bacterium]